MKELSKAERTRQLIIEKTAVIFNKKGFAGTSLSDLTEATGLTKGSIYGNFENKEEVALAVFDYNSHTVAVQIESLMAQATTYYEKLLVYTKVYNNPALAARGGCSILNTAVEADDTNPQLKDKAAKALERWRTRVANLIKGGIEAGEFKADVKVQQAALSIVALIEGAVMIAKLTDNPHNMAVALDTVKLMIDQMRD